MCRRFHFRRGAQRHRKKVDGEEREEDEEERVPPQLITHRLYPKKKQKMDATVFKAARGKGGRCEARKWPPLPL